LEPTGPGNPPRREVDVFAIKGGRLVVAECKASGSLEDRDIARTADAADRLDCSRVIYATPDRFPDDVVARARAGTTSRTVEVWQAWQLLDPRPGDGLQVDAARHYLEELADSTLATNP
jgi:hypothetical protein